MKEKEEEEEEEEEEESNYTRQRAALKHQQLLHVSSSSYDMHVSTTLGSAQL
jgi:hypothetical protein